MGVSVNGNVVMHVSVMNNGNGVGVMNSHDSIFILLLIVVGSLFVVCVMDGGGMDNLRVVNRNVVNGCVNNRHFNSDSLMMHNWLNVVSHSFVNDIVLGRVALLNDWSVMIDVLFFILGVGDGMMTPQFVLS